ncbi:hypothetical protein [Microvirga thermotolerans]|uniref:Uncharacterized protein n=1 Tax=Microvirga thermotolerans TaxID=2651334 RepID=A0A5P9JUC7_9HYPH|nr:hypothetical protein [Microvirga thermotolerans]QFU15236.1 hypothetical protein GDR74_02820 [Microvirga thermotolerans]
MRLSLHRCLAAAALVGGGLYGLLSTSQAQEFSLDGFRTCARADNGNHYCKTSASANWQRVPPEFYNRFKQAEADAAAGGSGRSKELQEIADFLNDLSQYMKQVAASGSPVNLAEIAKAAVSTKAAVESQNLKEAQNGQRRLEAMFKEDPGFAIFMRRFADERQQVLDRRISEAALEADKNIAFIQFYVAANILSQHTADLTKFGEQLAKALKERSLSGLNRVNGDFSRFVREKSLTDDYNSAMLAWTEKNTPKTSEDPQSALARNLGITDRTRFLVDGEKEELVFLYNTASGRIVKSLRGDLVFKDRKPTICFAQDRSIDRIRDLERLAMAQIQRQELDVESVRISQSACPIDGMEGYDILVFQRAGLLSQPLAYVSSVVRRVETNFSLLASIPGAEVMKAFQNEVESSAALEAQILNGKSSGFGLVFTNPSQGRICHTVSEDSEAHQIAVTRRTGTVFNVSTSDIVFTKTSLDNAFADFQTRKCNAIYASAKDLADVIKAMKRERLDYVVAPMWIDPLDIRAVIQAEASEMANLMAREEAARKALQQEEAILKQRALDEAVKRENIERDLQARNRSFARAAQDRISGMIDTFLAEVKASGDKRGDGVFGKTAELFPGFARVVKQLTRDRWELESKSYAVVDFGDADWNNRKVEAVIVRTELLLQNKPLGRRDAVCFFLGVVVDAEFDHLRDPITVSCDDSEEAVRRWQVGSKFSSRWRAAAK